MTTKKNEAAQALAALRVKKQSPEVRSAIASGAGKASAAALTPAQRRAKAKKAVEARWEKKKAK
jgi:hypothetical protein